jgi:peptide deformylase
MSTSTQRREDSILGNVLLLGDPRLRQISEPVRDLTDSVLKSEISRLMAVLEAFRAKNGFGRAIAAPQIGIAKRLIALNLGKGPFCVANPQITWKSRERFTLWDDCMSFPFLLVRLSRHTSISVRYTDEEGVERNWEKLDRSTSELLQHETDHLDGVLAIDHAIDRDALVSRTTFEDQPEYFRAQVD